MKLRPAYITHGIRPLYFDKGVLYGSKYSKLYRSDDAGRTFTPFAHLQIPTDRFTPLTRYSSLARRVIRSGVYRMRILSNGNMVFIYRKGVYTLGANEIIGQKTYDVRWGSRPVSLAYKPGGLVVFGEYWDNPDRGPIHILGSQDEGMTWQAVYTFGSNQILHIHGIAYDKWDDCFWICTGDDDGECRLLKASADFSDVQIIRKGGQEFRYFSLIVSKEKLIMATDTPIDTNFIFRYDKSSDEMICEQEVENSCFFSGVVNNYNIISTTAEPSSINDIYQCHLWICKDDENQWQKTATYSIDFYQRLSIILPIHKALFQFPTVFFPEGENTTGYMISYGTGIKNFDDCMFSYDLRDMLV